MRIRRIVLIALVLAIVLDVARASAQATPPPAPPAGPTVAAAPLTVAVNWRVRMEGWDFFGPATGENAYAFEHTLLSLDVGQRRRSFAWSIEGAADGIFDIPQNAVQPGATGQLGLGGAYSAANGAVRNTASAFLKQANLGFSLPAAGTLKLGRLVFLDGTEGQPQDKTVSTLVTTRIAQRLIGDFGFSAVQRSFDGAVLAFKARRSTLTIFAARPTQGVFQSQGMKELNVDVLYGSWTMPVTSAHQAGELRLFAIDYLDDRSNVLKTDNRPSAIRSADSADIRVDTYGADYVHVVHTATRGQFDVLAWGAFQNGRWGALAQRAGAFVGEAGWQAPLAHVNPWFSAGYSYGSGDSNPGDSVHGTFFQVLPTPRPYDRLPFYNMMNNADAYGTAAFTLPHAAAIRSEVHALRLASAADLWYAGGGAFQPNAFGYTGRPSNGARSLADVWDVSLDVPLRARMKLTAYYGHAWGKAVVASIFTSNKNASFGYVEVNVRF